MQSLLSPLKSIETFVLSMSCGIVSSSKLYRGQYLQRAQEGTLLVSLDNFRWDLVVLWCLFVVCCLAQLLIDDGISSFFMVRIDVLSSFTDQSFYSVPSSWESSVHSFVFLLTTKWLLAGKFQSRRTKHSLQTHVYGAVNTTVFL